MVGSPSKKELLKILCFDPLAKYPKHLEKNIVLQSPIRVGIKEINRLFDKGYMIKLFTSRYMGRNNDLFQSIVNKVTLMTLNQLYRNAQYEYHKLIFGKPSFD